MFEEYGTIEVNKAENTRINTCVHFQPSSY